MFNLILKAIYTSFRKVYLNILLKIYRSKTYFFFQQVFKFPFIIFYLLFHIPFLIRWSKEFMLYHTETMSDLVDKVSQDLIWANKYGIQSLSAFMFWAALYYYIFVL